MKALALLCLLLCSSTAFSTVITVSTDSNGFATQLFFDARNITASDIPFGQSKFSAQFFISKSVHDIDYEQYGVALIHAGFVDEVLRIGHTVGNDIRMDFFTLPDPYFLSVANCGRIFEPSSCVLVDATGGVQDVTGFFPPLPFKVLVRSDPAAVPEPATWALLLIALLAPFSQRIRRSRG